MNKQTLQNIYQNHHARGKRYGYLYCHGERGHYLKEWIGQGKKVLDLGCRDGMLTSFYAEGNEVMGADIDQKALELIQQKLKIQTRWLDLNSEWPFEEESFDVIVACEIMEHLFFLDSFLHSVFKTLKKGGIFIGSVPNAFRMRNRMKFLFGKEYENDPTHVRQFSYHKVKRVLSDKFIDIQIVPIQGKVLPFLPVSAPIPFSLKRLFSKDLLWICQRPKE